MGLACASHCTVSHALLLHNKFYLLFALRFYAFKYTLAVNIVYFKHETFLFVSPYINTLFRVYQGTLLFEVLSVAHTRKYEQMAVIGVVHF